MFLIKSVYCYFLTKSEPVYEEESKTLDCLKAKCLCINPFTQRTALIISSCTWQVKKTHQAKPYYSLVVFEKF